MDYEKLATEEIKVMSTNSEVKPWHPPINRVLRVLLEKLKKFGPINPAEMSINMNLFHILDFVWQTLNLGFWESKEQIKGILQDVLNILKPHPIINGKYAEARI